MPTCGGGRNRGVRRYLAPDLNGRIGLGRKKLETDAARGRGGDTPGNCNGGDAETRRTGKQAQKHSNHLREPLHLVQSPRYLTRRNFPSSLLSCSVILLLSQKLTITRQVPLLPHSLTPSFFQPDSVCVRTKLTRFRNLSVGSNLLCTHFEFSGDGWELEFDCPRIRHVHGR